MKNLVIDGVEYAPVIKNTTLDGLEYVMVRTNSAGVFAGYLVSLEGSTVILKEARRIWMWQGAASLSQLATSGTSKPLECKFPENVVKVILNEVIEVITITEAAKASIDSVPVWKA